MSFTFIALVCCTWSPLIVWIREILFSFEVEQLAIYGFQNLFHSHSIPFISNTIASRVINMQLPVDTMKYLILSKGCWVVKHENHRMCFSALRKIKFYSGYLCPKMNKEIKAKCGHGKIKRIYCILWFFLGWPYKR